MKTKRLALLMALALLVGLLAGCGAPASSAETTSTPAESTSEAPEEPLEPPEETLEPPAASAVEPESAVEDSIVEAPMEYATMAEKYAAMSKETNASYKALQEGVGTEISYPLDDAQTLTMWRVFSAFIWNGLMESYADMPTLPIIEAATGVHMKFIECSDSAAYEQFNLTIATGDYPDLMAMDYYSGGVTAAYEDDVILDLTDLVDAHMPNYMALVDTMDDYTKKSIYTDDNRILRIWTLASNVVSEQGLSYRSDWAEEFGIDQIVTVDDMFDYLTQVKNKYNCTYPIFVDNSGVLEGFTGAYGTAGMNLGWTDLGMMMDGDTVISSLTDEHFKNYIAGFNKFYSAGLIKDNFYNESYGPDYINAYVMEDQCAVTSIRGDKFTTMTENAVSPTFRFEATAPLVEQEGDTYKFRMKTSHTGMGNMSITTGCDDPEMALEFMNWFYTWDGYMVTNYGEEGLCFEYNEDGDPVYTDFIVHNPDGYNVMNLRNMYTNPVFNNYTNATAVFYTYDEVELNAFDIWNNNGTDECSMPTLSLTTDENAEYANIASTVYTYATEQVLKWMIGENALTDESWNAYVDQCNAMDLPRCVEIYQAVYNRMYL